MRRPWLALVVLAACRSPAGGVDAGPVDFGVADRAAASSAVPPMPPPAAPPAPAVVATDWCIEGFSALDEEDCYVLPMPAAGAPRRLLVYLHGIVPPRPDSPQKRNFETAVLEASVRSGVAALVPRGRRGLGPVPGARDWWAWPTTSAAIAEMTPALVARWAASKKKLEELAGAPFERTYLAGSSNGAYYVSALALRGDVPTPSFPVDGFGAMSGGAAGGTAAHLSTLAPRPFYVGFGTYDEQSRTNARGLIAVLRAARWPVRSAEHPLSHGANEVYLEEAFAFWGEAEDAGN
ncbi:MAG TPA: hypothetical protein VGL81_00340 [Polyangiaceae bacterium]|jgi:predicted esterase